MYKIIYAKAVLEGKELIPLENHCIIVKDSVIQEILPEEEGKRKAGEGWESYDLRHLTVMPGMIESHNHLALDARIPGHLEMMNDGPVKLSVLAINSLRDDLMSGVTTARCMGDRHYLDTIMKGEIAAGRVIGPRLITCGIGMRGLHGHGFVGLPHTGEEEYRKTARENMLQGCDHLKIFITGGAPPKEGNHVPYYITFDEMRTVVEEGAQLGLKVSSHCIGGEGLVKAVEAGVYAFDHLYCASDDEIELLIKRGRWAVPTMTVYLDPDREACCPPFKVANIHRCRDQIRKRMEVMLHSGVKYAFGTDANHTFLYKEAVYARELGISARDCLKGLTVWGAELCGISDRTGSLEPGLDANLIAVDGNPYQDLSCLKNVAFVLKQGEVYKNVKQPPSTITG